MLSHAAKKRSGALVPSGVKKAPPPLMVWKWPSCLLKCRVKVLVLVGIPKPPMRAATFEAAPVWIKAVLFPYQMVGSVRSDETMSRNAMTPGTELFAFGFCEQVWAKTGSDSIEDPLFLGRKSMHYGRYSHLAKNNPSYREGERVRHLRTTSRTLSYA